MQRLGQLLIALALALGCRKAQQPAPETDRVREPETDRVRQPEKTDRARLERDVAAVAKPRLPGSDGWRQVQRYCADRLTALGYQIEHHTYGTGTNVIGTKLGRVDPEQRVIVSAHYDHIAGCAGADDNASGVAAVLEIARQLASVPAERSLVVAFWDEEERGLIGSRAYADRAGSRSERIIAALSLDAVGFRSAEPSSQRVPPGFEAVFPDVARELAVRRHTGDFLAVVANPKAAAAAQALARHARRVGLPLVGLTVDRVQAALLPDTLRSDHASFWSAGYPGLLLTDTGELRNPGYHCLAAPDLARHRFFDPSYRRREQLRSATDPRAALICGVAPPLVGRVAESCCLNGYDAYLVQVGG
jgi:hypothetical protein